MVEKKREYTVEDFFKDHQDELELELLTSSLKGPLNITSSDVHRPAFALSGFMENYLNTRIQIIAETETLFLRSLDSGQIRDAAVRIFSQPLCCIVITKAWICRKYLSTKRRGILCRFSGPLRKLRPSFMS